uniref:Protein kinase domain-containing protein n=2 Tax=Lotharella globosa TaxID=91324 RepID=A0A7S3YNC6_9EUKA
MERRRREDDGLKDNDATSSNSTLLPALIDGKRNLASWNFIRGIGIGQFGSVVVVQQKEMTPPEAALETREDQTTKEVSSRAFAMKCIGKMKVIAEDAVHRTVQELRVLSRIDHPFVIKLESAFQDESNLYLITELCEGGNLEALLANHHSVGVATVRFLMGQLLLALEHVHGMGVVHMDVNPGNCLLDSKGNLRLADFNASRILPSKGVATSKQSSPVGTPGYMPPEVLTAQMGYSVSPDFWCMGVCIYRLLHGQHSWPFPFKDHQGALLSPQKMLESVEKIRIPPIDKRLPQEAAEIIQELLVFEWTERLGSRKKGVAEIKAHSFFEHIDWGKLRTRDIAPGFVPPADALYSEAADKITITKWAVEQFNMAEENKAPLTDQQQALFRDWQYSRSSVKPAEQTLLDQFMAMNPQKIKELIGKCPKETIEMLVDQIKELKRQWLDENCKVSLARLANHDLKMENAMLEDRMSGLTQELHIANMTIMNLKKSLIETSDMAAQEGRNVLNPLKPILRQKTINSGAASKDEKKSHS